MFRVPHLIENGFDCYYEHRKEVENAPAQLGPGSSSMCNDLFTFLLFNF
jgi:hypothetical protein